MKEIGSEFWGQADVTSIQKTQDEENNIACLLSGRTALDFIIQDIKAERSFQEVMLPSYCCESMIEPFIKNDIRVNFYKVGFNYANCDFQENCDAILLLDYFGYEDKKIERIAQSMNAEGKVIIYDATHKLNGHLEVEKYANYSFCSYRKWFYSNYAIAVKHKGQFLVPKPSLMYDKYLALRNRAAKLKFQYMEGTTVNKNEFLALYGEAETLLEKDYVGYMGIPSQIDIKSLVQIRRGNARYLIEELKEIAELKLWRNSINENDVPLFVPVFLNIEMRDLLRNHLLKNDIYCPTHWPISDLHMIDKDKESIYLKELSLVCDQRYQLEDMEREVAVIKRFFGEYRE